MYDPELEDYFSMYEAESNTNPEWWLGEALWTTVQKAGLISGM